MNPQFTSQDLNAITLSLEHGSHSIQVRSDRLLVPFLVILCNLLFSHCHSEGLDWKMSSEASALDDEYSELLKKKEKLVSAVSCETCWPSALQDAEVDAKHALVLRNKANMVCSAQNQCHEALLADRGGDRD